MQIAWGVTEKSEDSLLIYMPNSGKDIMSFGTERYKPSLYCSIPWDLRTPQAHLWREVACSITQKVSLGEMAPTKAYSELFQTASRLNGEIRTDLLKSQIGPTFMQMQRTLTWTKATHLKTGITPDPFLVPDKITKLVDKVCEGIGEDYDQFKLSANALTPDSGHPMTRDKFRRWFRAAWYDNYHHLRPDLSCFHIQFAYNHTRDPQGMSWHFEKGKTNWSEEALEPVHIIPRVYTPARRIKVPASLIYEVFKCD